MAPRLALLAVLLCGLLAGSSGYAGERQLDEDLAPESVDELPSSMEQGFREVEVVEPLTNLREHLEDAPTFLRDSDLTLHLRSYYRRRKLLDNSRAEAWAGGGWLAYKSGWLAERLRAGATVYGSYRLSADKDRGGTGLLEPVQQSYTVVGESYATVRLAEDHELSLYRKKYDIGYINPQDSRMTPNTFEGYTLGGKWGGEVNYVAGYLTRMKMRNSDRFVPMSEAAGAVDHKRGTAVVGFLYASEYFSLGVGEYFTDDTLNIFYVESRQNWNPGEELSIQTSVYFTDQRSAGGDLLTGSSFNTRVWMGRVAASYHGAILSVSGATVDDDDRIISPFGTYPGPLSTMLRNFSRASEDAFAVSTSYNFTEVGIPDLAFVTKFAAWYNARGPSGTSLPDETEVNLTLDYRIRRGLLRGFWVRLRGAFQNQNGGDSQNEFRLILNYDVPVL